MECPNCGFQNYEANKCTYCGRKLNPPEEPAAVSEIRDAEFYYSKGEEHRTKKELKMAISFYIKALQVEPKHGYSFCHMGHCQSDLGLDEDAMKSYKRVVEIDPNDSLAYLHLAMSQSKLGLHQDAIKSYKCSIKIDPNNSEAYYPLGLIQSHLGLLEDAIKSYKRAIEINPAFSLAYIYLGLSQSHLGLFEDAIKSYNRAIEIDPDDSNAYYNLALSQEKLSIFNSALKNFETYLLLEDLSLPANQNEIEYAKKRISELKQRGKNEIGDRDGSSIEKAIVVGSVGEEYTWIQNYCQGFHRQVQALQEINGKAYDVLTLVNEKGDERILYFDISGFYSKDHL